MTTTHTQNQATSPEPRYGNWRRPRTAGLLGLGTTPTLGALGWVLTSLLCMLFNILVGWIMLLAGVVLLAPLALRLGDRSLYSVALARWVYRRGRAKRATQLLNGPLGLVPGGKHHLPGLLAASEVYEAQDGFGRPFGLLHLRAAGTWTAVLRCDADGDQLVDRDTVDTWVAGWAAWLARLGQVPGLEAATVTVDTAPDSGQRLRTEVHRLTSGPGPHVAQQILRETADDYPVTAAQVHTHVALVFRSRVSSASKPRTAEEMAVEIGSRLPALGRELAVTGAGAARPMTSTQLAEFVFAAYNPAEAPELDAARDTAAGHGITWDNAGPNGVSVERRDHYLHGSGASITYAMEEAPRGAVLSGVLTDFLAPHSDFDRKRVTLIYRPHEPGEAATIVERDLKHARTLATKRAVVAARDDADVRAAQQAADEEASGAGLVRFALLATATVTDSDSLRQVDATLHNLAATARIRLRRVYGGQSAAFAAGLGVGVLPHTVATLGGLFDAP